MSGACFVDAGSGRRIRYAQDHGTAVSPRHFDQVSLAYAQAVLGAVLMSFQGSMFRASIVDSGSVVSSIGLLQDLMLWLMAKSLLIAILGLCFVLIVLIPPLMNRYCTWT